MLVGLVGWLDLVGLGEQGLVEVEGGLVGFWIGLVG